jgi:hypothetical protein
MPLPSCSLKRWPAIIHPPPHIHVDFLDGDPSRWR